MQGKNVESGLRVRKLRFFFILLLAGGFALLDLPHLSTNGAQWPSIGVPSALIGDMIAEAVVARKLETTGHEILKAVHPHPTMSEAVMEATAAAYDEVIHL